ncbi:hypothetical protein V1264_014122 [Littorina saxatilis]|uniref:G protein-coupled receptor n=1 Tax=Littorina saxatilis TaxID=31220 RepID=A0AAN9BS66_9CAEN
MRCLPKTNTPKAGQAVIFRRLKMFTLAHIFHVFTLVLPQFLQLVFVLGMVHGIRRYRLWLASGKLQLMIAKSCLAHLATNGTCMTSADRSVLKSVVRLCAGKSRSNRIISESAHNVGQLLSVEVYQHLADYVQRELLVTKAVTIFCIPTIFIYSVGFTVGIYFRNHSREARDTFFLVMDVLQLINCGCTFLVLAALLPSFRRALLRRLRKKDMTDSSEVSVGSTLPPRLCLPQSSSSSSDKLGEEGISVVTQEEEIAVQAVAVNTHPKTHIKEYGHHKKHKSRKASRTKQS